VVKLAPGSYAGESVKPKWLSSVLTERIETLRRGERQWFGCMCVTVRRDDGASWSAEAASRVLARDYPTFKRWLLADTITTEGLPVIAPYVGVTSFLKLAADHKLTTSFLTLRSWMTPAICLLAVLVGVATRMFGVLVKASSERPGQTPLQIFSDPAFYAWSAALAALGLLAQWLGTYLTTREKSLEAFVKDLTAKQGSLAYKDFIDSLVRRLQGIDMPRFVLLDNFERLDFTTREVVKRYFQMQGENARGSEFWVIFEGEDGERFSSYIQLDRQTYYGYKQTELYRQELLTGEEKRDLVRVANRPPAAAEFATVKSICRGGDEGEQRIQKLFQEYRLRHPKDPARYGNLEFLFLLSLTASPGEVALGRTFLLSRLSQKESVQAEVLKRFLHRTTAVKAELEHPLSEIIQDFRSVLILEPEDEPRQLRVEPEAAAVLEKSADGLQLPDAGIGHLYWALLWYDEWKGRPAEARGMRKLAGHLLRSDVSQVRKSPQYEQILRQTLEICLFTVNGCLKTCLFSDVPRLLERAVSLLQSDFPGDAAPSQKRLLRECWKAYSVLGHEDILGYVVDLYGLPGMALPAEAAAGDLLADQFLQAMPLQPLRREILKAALVSPVGADKGGAESIVGYAQARSAWLAVTAGTLLSDWSGSDLRKALLSCETALQELSEQAFHRIQNKVDQGARVTDVMALSLSLWCRALQFNPLVRNHVLAVRLQKAAGPDIFVLEGASLDRHWTELVDAAEGAVLLASSLNKESAGPTPDAPGIDFLMSGLARELCAVSLASLIAGCRYLSDFGPDLPEASSFRRVRDVFQFAAELWGYPLPALSSHQDLLRVEVVNAVDELLKLCGILWHTFELDRLRDFLSVRRLHFQAISRDLQPDHFEAYRPVLEAAGPALQARDFAGLIANFVVADCFKASAELVAHYLQQAGAIALEQDFGAGFKHEISLLVLAHSHHLRTDLGTFLQDLLSPASEGGSFLASFLKGLPLEKLPDQFLQLLNASNPRVSTEISGEIRRTLVSSAETIPEGGVKREVRSLLEIHLLGERVRSGEAFDFAGELHHWTDRKDLWLYGSLLHLLLDHGYVTPEVVGESVALLHREPGKDTFNAYHLLAFSLLSRVLEPPPPGDQRRAALAYLQGSIGKWEGESSADLNLGVFQTLSRLDPPGRQNYQQHLLKWQTIKLQRDHLQRLPQLIQQGRYFLIFREYFRSMLYWGLALDTPWEEFHASLEATPDRRRALLGEWKAGGGAIPNPTHSAGRQDVIAAEFLRLGEYLFSPPSDQDQAFAPDRQGFDEAARNHLGVLLGMIVRLPNLPRPVGQLLRNYAARLYNYTLPAGEALRVGVGG
jgi:hypothetical protein